MTFTPHTQTELQNLKIIAGNTYTLEYANKDYYNGEETIEKGNGVAFVSEGNIYFTVTDPYAMEKLIMKVRIL